MCARERERERETTAAYITDEEIKVVLVGFHRSMENFTSRTNINKIKKLAVCAKWEVACWQTTNDSIGSEDLAPAAEGLLR